MGDNLHISIPVSVFAVDGAYLCGMFVLLFTNEMFSRPMVAVEEVRERYGTHPCDQRSSVRSVSGLFEHVDFGAVETDEDTWHSDKRESIEDLHARYD